jgi:NAD(P)-dependent dehydrogenase (short-subunit alcohol dehydrogenase family)
MNWIKDTRWLITGGTSGLGLALTRAVVEAGGRVAVVARTERDLIELAESLSIIPITADVSKKEDIYKIAAQALGQLGGLDYLVNNASAIGVTPLRLLIDTDCETLEEVLETNLTGPFRLTKAVLPSMLLQGRGTIINISSDAAVNAYSRWGAYSASKAALDHLSHVWGEELKEHNIQFLSIDPGDMDTPLHAQAIPDADVSRLKRPDLSAHQILELLKEHRTSGWMRRSL